jgi:hypothetical protein
MIHHASASFGWASLSLSSRRVSSLFFVVAPTFCRLPSSCILSHRIASYRIALHRSCRQTFIHYITVPTMSSKLDQLQNATVGMTVGVIEVRAIRYRQSLASLSLSRHLSTSTSPSPPYSLTLSITPPLSLDTFRS